MGPPTCDDELWGAANVESVGVAAGVDPADWAEANAGSDARIARAKNFFIEIVLTCEFPCEDRIHAHRELSRTLCEGLLKNLGARARLE
ncbi:MAG: hypothetical protein NVS9B14_00470 [Candidatus Acidiferrum sp.]